MFCVDSSESELGILDLIQVFVETLDKCFENVCELDLIFHADAVHHILAELVMGGMVLQTNMSDILARIEDQNKLVKQEAGISAASARAVSAVKSLNLQQQIKDIKLPDLPQAIKDLKFWPMDELCFEIDYIDEKVMEPIIATMVDYEVIESSTRPPRRHFLPFKFSEYYQNDSLPLTFKKSHSNKDEQSLSLISRKNKIKYT